MKRFFPLFMCVGLLLTTSEGDAAPRVPQLHETPAEQVKRLEWFQNAKFGLFIHWGPAALSGEEISWGMKGRIEGGVQHQKVPREEYMNLYKQFNPQKFDADRLLGLASAAGMKYVVFVTKHHDGFCMWNTAQKRFTPGAEFPEHYSIADSPYGKDPCRMIQQAANKQGMKLGWYYSTRDWTHPDYLKGDNQKYNAYYEAQVEELMREYGPVDLMWFDHAMDNWSQYTIPRLFEKMYLHNPNLLVNNRAARLLKNIPKEYARLDQADFDTPENRVGNFQNTRPWESCMILSPHADHGGWSYRTGSQTRSLTETLRLLSSVVCGDGNMLLNLAPMADGSLKPEEEAVLQGIAPWMKANRQAIENTRGGPWINGRWGGATQRGKEVYVHVFEPGDEPLVLRGLKQKVLSASTLSGKKIKFKQADKGLSLHLPVAVRDAHVTVVKLVLDKPVPEVILGPALITKEVPDPLGTLALLPAGARVEGGVKAETTKSISRLVGWGDAAAAATWDLGISSPGHYQLLVDLAAVEDGAQIQVKIGQRVFRGKVAQTGSLDLDQTLEVGQIYFPNAEQTTLSVSAGNPGQWKQVALRHVKLVPSSR